MRDKIGCRDDFDYDLQNFSESFGKLNIIRNTVGKHQRVINRVVHSLFSLKNVRIFCVPNTEEEISPFVT